MSIRRAIVEIDPSTINVTEFCRSHGVSTWFFWDLRRRFAVEGEAALTPKSRAPRRVANRTPARIEGAIVAKRKELLDAGFDAGAGSIAFHLRHLPGLPTESTIWRILKARGFITPDPTKAPKHAHRSFTAERANDCWQLDDTTWELAGGAPVKILNVIDDHSRLAVASVALESCTGAATLTALATAATTLGWPARFLSDNAKAFRQVLAEALGAMGIAHGHSRPYHPQTNGKVERFHQTLKRWLRRQNPPHTIDELQAQLDIFRFIYNHQRNHRSLDRQFPADVWSQAPKNGPADQPIGQPTHIYQQTVHGGILQLGRRYRVSVGATYNGQRPLAIITGTACHVFLDGQLIRFLTINPNRKHQPLHSRPGRPTQLP
jgi:transposase InsO family protein